MEATGDEISALIEQLRDDSYYTRDRVGEQLGIIGLPAVPALLRAMDDPDAAVRQGAAGALAKIGGPEAVAALTAALADLSDEVRGWSALALGGLGGSGTAEALTAALGDDASWVRQAAAVSLGTLGDAGNVSALLPMLADEDSGVASSAAFALQSVGWPGAAEAILALFERDPDEYEEYGFSDEATEALAKAGPAAVPACLAALDHKNRMVRSVAIMALGLSEDPRAVGPLMALLTDADPSARSDAANALPHLGLKESVDALLTATKAPSAELRLAAVEILGWCGDERAIRPLRALETAGDAALEGAVAEAVRRLLWPGGETNIEALIAALQDSDEKAREGAARALGESGDARTTEALLGALDIPGAWFWAAHALGNRRERRAVEPLCRLLRDGAWNVRRSAAAALWYIADGRSTEALFQALGDEEFSVRGSAALALGRLQESRAVRPLLGLLWNDGDITVRTGAVRALGAIGDPATRADLRAAWFDKDINVFRAAQEALERFGEAALCAPD